MVRLERPLLVTATHFDDCKTEKMSKRVHWIVFGLVAGSFQLRVSLVLGCRRPLCVEVSFAPKK